MGRRQTAPTQDLSPRHLNHDDSDAAFAAPTDDVDYGTKFEYDPNFDGPVKKRSCTDIICLILFIAFLAGWGVVAGIGFVNGDIKKIINPTDSLGRICGHGELTNRPFLIFFDLTRCLNPAVLTMGCPTPQVCVSKCPGETFSGLALAHSGQEAAAKQKMKPFCQPMPENEWEKLSAEQLIKKDLCPAWVLPSQPILRRCLPIGATSNQTENVVPPNETIDGKPIKGQDLTNAIYQLSLFLNLRDFGERIFNDLRDTWWMIGLAYLGCSCLSFIWVMIMRFFACVMVWTSIGLVFLLVTGLLGYSVYRYILVKDVAGSILQVNFTPSYLEDVLALRDTWLAFLIILAILAIIILLILIALRQRIQIAIELIEEGSKAVSHNLSAIFFPVIPFILHIVVILWFAAVAMYLSSYGTSTYMIFYEDGKNAAPDNRPPPDCGPGNCINPNTNQSYLFEDKCTPEIFDQTCRNCPKIQCQFTKYERSALGFGLQWFNLFGLYWSFNFVTSFGEIVLAGVFATWYWTYEKSKLPCCILGTSMSFALIYHLGTIAFGSLIIAIIKFIRAILSFIESKLKMYNNDLTKCLLCCCKCCLWCLEKFMKFINRNAYIICAVKGTNFCSSAKTAVNLLMRNILRVVVLNNVVDFLLFLGKLVIIAGTGAMSYFVFARQIPDLNDTIPNLNYFFTPVIFIVIGSYFITCSFFGVYSMAVDTLFLCFLEDLERNDGSPERPYFMSKNLRRVVGKMQKFKENQKPMQMVPPHNR